MALEAPPSLLPASDRVYAAKIWYLRISGTVSPGSYFLYYSLSMHRENFEFGTASICFALTIIVIEARHATESGRYPAAALSKFRQTVMKT